MLGSYKVLEVGWLGLFIFIVFWEIDDRDRVGIFLFFFDLFKGIRIDIMKYF